MKNIIPEEALDQRLLAVGMSGSGKTFTLKGAAERLLVSSKRIVVLDLLDVWYGLALREDGKTPAPWRKQKHLVIFGGPHGDIPLNEHAGALIGETCATMRESAIVSLGGKGKQFFRSDAARRRFALAFLTALYEATDPTKVDPYHIIIDEADFYAPQMPDDPALLGQVNEIVRRGRVSGFIPWLITQRPAILNKNVLSQADGMIAMQLTSSQDRKAIHAWIEGQADAADEKRIMAELPKFERGQGVLWVPRLGIIATMKFPRNSTYDSSRTPERGEARRAASIEPVDLSELKAKMTDVIEDAKAHDPKALRIELADLRRQLEEAQSKPAGISSQELAAERAEGFRDGVAQMRRDASHAVTTALREFHDDLSGLSVRHGNLISSIADTIGQVTPISPRSASRAPMPGAATPKTPAKTGVKPERRASNAPVREGGRLVDGIVGATIANRRRAAILAWPRHRAGTPPTRRMVGAVAGYNQSGTFRNLLSELKVGGIICYPSPNAVALTARGYKLGVAPTRIEAKARLLSLLGNPAMALVTALQDQYPNESTREALAQITDREQSGTFRNLLSELHVLDVIAYPQRGTVRLTEWAFNLLR